MIRVVLVDDQVLVRAGLRALLDSEDGIEVVGEAGDGAEALSLARELAPDVMLMDIRMPGVDGLEATRQIAAEPRLAEVRIVILTTFDLDEYVFEGLRSGASGFLVKDTEPADLLHGIRVAARGDALLSPSITGKLISEYVSRPPHHSRTALSDVLTNREREVVALVARGRSNDEIAALMVISVATVKTHVSRAMTKLQVRDRARLVVLAYESGLVTPGRAR